MAEYIKNPLSGKLRGVTYEDGKIIDVHIRDTDDVVKVFVPVRHGRWEPVTEGVWNLTTPVLVGWRCSECGRTENTKEPYCNCGSKMHGESDE